MTKQEIFEIESSNTGRIHLFGEGILWIAYERSAFLFVRSVKPYRVKKKSINNIGQDTIKSEDHPKRKREQFTEPTLAFSIVVSYSRYAKYRNSEKPVRNSNVSYIILRH